MGAIVPAGWTCPYACTHPKEFREDTVALARRSDAPVSKIAKDLGISESCLPDWLHAADVEDGRRPGATASEARRCVSLVSATGCWSRRTRSCARPGRRPRARACVRSLARSAGTRRRSLESCVATRRLAAGSWTTGRQSRSGKPTWPRVDQRRRNWSQTRGCTTPTGTALRADPPTRRDRGRRAATAAVDREQQAAPQGSGVDVGVESGADLQPDQGRLPR